jgi:hypothetical protein
MATLRPSVHRPDLASHLLLGMVSAGALAIVLLTVQSPADAVEDPPVVEQCAPGTFGVGGAAPCTPAPAGTFVAGTGASSTTDCPIGRFQPAEGSTDCLPAPTGTYVATVRATSATPCPAGRFNDQTAQTSDAACRLVPAGSFSSAGAATATDCPVGRFQPEAGRSDCIPAPVGTYVAAARAVAATPCPAGTFNNQYNENVCYQCNTTCPT